jgi:hypothetical protein
MKKLSYQLPLVLALAIAVSVIIFSCKKEVSLSGQEEEYSNVMSTQSDAEAEILFNGIFDDVMGVSDTVGISGTGIFGTANITSGAGSSSRIDPAPPCLLVTRTHLSGSTYFPIRIVYDFGTSGCSCADGHIRRGKIINTYSAALREPGAVATTEFDGFYIDSIHVEGTHTITNVSTTTYVRKFRVDVTDAKLTKTNGNYSFWNSHKGIVQTEGFLAINIADYVFKIGGSASGRVKRDNLLVGWTSEITDSLVKRFSCHWISRGKVRTIRETLPSTSQWVGILDYGYASPPNTPAGCDNQAQLKVNDHYYTITLR